MKKGKIFTEKNLEVDIMEKWNCKKKIKAELNEIKKICAAEFL